MFEEAKEKNKHFINQVIEVNDEYEVVVSENSFRLYDGTLEYEEGCRFLCLGFEVKKDSDDDEALWVILKPLNDDVHKENTNKENVYYSITSETYTHLWNLEDAFKILERH